MDWVQLGILKEPLTQSLNHWMVISQNARIEDVVQKAGRE